MFLAPVLPDSEFLGKEGAIGDVGGAHRGPLAVVVLNEFRAIGESEHMRLNFNDTGISNKF